MQRRVLALLLLRANRLVTSERLIEELWGESSPKSARTTLQTYVYQLRKLFVGQSRPDGRPPAAAVELVTRNNGYELHVGDETVIDLMEFERLLQRSRVLRTQGLLEEASDALRAALSWWSGNALADIRLGPLLNAETVRLDEERKNALETRIDIDLQLGRHYDLASELTVLCMEQPTHEGFAAKLMLTLYRCQRRTEALAVYQRLRQQLVTELGLDPSGEVQRLHKIILDGALRHVPARQELAAVRMPTRPSFLPPPDPGVFIDGDLRDQALWHLDTADGGPARAGIRSRILTVLGPPGGGATSFALTVAQQLRSAYPDGQFFASIDTTGPDREAMRGILQDFLEASGVPTDGLPRTLAGLSAAFQSWSANRRVLVVIDNAVSAAHLQLLQPGGSGSVMLVTGRMRRDGCNGDAVLETGPLDTERALALLADAVGAERVQREPALALRLLTLCDRLPVVLGAMAQRLALRPHWSISRLVARLEDPASRLAQLADTGTALVHGVHESRALLSEPGREALRAVVEHGCLSVGADTLAALMGIRVQDAQLLLEQLADAYLLIEEQDGAPGPGQGSGPLRYRLPLLFRLVISATASPSRVEQHLLVS
ncbi:AfsR/SARP family transcriptional regulator [Streptomyces celluloflavus]|uniref:AfsR/SARP family transcriptional regulator n=1 Tax=Streptomyces celluloflavus TaxID=58344 RepID=UPI0036460543